MMMAALGVFTPADAAPIPGITVNDYGNPGAVSPGRVFLAVASETVDTGVGVYLMIVNNDGTIAWSKETSDDEIYDFKVLPNGHLHYAAFIEPHSWTGGGDVVHEILDENYNPKETITGGNGYVAESHDFQLLPNGNVLQFGYYMSEVDMSKIVAGGHPAAKVSGAVIQELDANRNVVFQWRTWDHYPFAGNVTGTAAVINAFHINTIFKDLDGNIIIGTPQLVTKINRQTGEIMWHLGGTQNQFTFAGGGASGDFGGHAMNLLPNGNYLIYDNGGRGTTGAPSKAHEYILDQVNKVATRVWTYTSSPSIKAWHRGSAQRLPGGNTLIGWGGASGAAVPTCTEVTPSGQKVFDISFTNPLVESYRAVRFPWPPDEKLEFMHIELTAGNTYVFNNTGVSLDVQAGGGDYNEFTVTRAPYAPVDPVFPETAPRVLPLRVKMNESDLPGGSLTAQVNFDAASFGFNQPNQLTIYYRPEAGQGIFFPQVTTYNFATGQLRTTIELSSAAGDMGEFIFGYPDLPDVAYPPLLAKPENYRGVQTHEVIAPPLAIPGVVSSVNQTLPVMLSWSPKGMARSYELEIATNQDFATPVVQVDYQTVANYVMNTPLPNTIYYYRVRTRNNAGASAWSVGSFQTVAPLIQVATPNGYEAWRRGLKYYIQWNDNVAESVVIDLYKGGVFLKELAASSSAGAWQWEAGLDLAPGNDYAIRVRSSTEPALFAFSAATFGIDVPNINPGSLIRLSNGQVQFSLTAPGASEAKVQGSTNLADWLDLGTVPVTNGSAIFTDTTAPGMPSRFYRLNVAP